MPHYSGAEILVAQLVRQNIEILPGIPGGSNLPIYDVLRRSTIRHVLARHEQGAGFIAQGMARSTGIAAACLVTSGPGATNVLSAIADAYADSVPIVAIAGQVPTSMLGTNAFQEIDLVGMAMSITKHVFQPRSPEELAENVMEAFQLAQSGRPGPVIIDLPKDVQQARGFLDKLPEPLAIASCPSISAAKLNEAIALMQRAERPVLYLGGGANAPLAAEACERLARRWDAPMALSLMALGTVAVDHPLCLGMLGMHGAVTTNQWVAEADVVLALGTRFGDRSTGQPGTQCPNARVIHVDIDPSEHHKLRPADIAIVGDVREVATRLCEGLPMTTIRGTEARVARCCSQDEHRLPKADPRGTRGILSYMAHAFGEDAFVATDVGQHQMRVAQSYPFRKPKRWLTSGGLGTMGFGLPAALGAALANPNANVLCFTGDGSLMMNVQELATLAEERANVTIVVMDNACLGLVGQQQSLFFGEHRHGCDYSRPSNIVAIATAFGIETCDLASSEPGEAIVRAQRQKAPLLLRLPVDAHEHVLPMVPPGAANSKPIRCHPTVTT
jgi:acetolactate synthase-1/2/3 large subunit